MVYDFQALEEMPFSFAEVQTYIQGITVSGHKVTDEAKLKQQILGWQKLIELVKTDTFAVSKEVSCSIQEVIAKNEVLEVGQFRSGQVSITGTEYRPPKADDLDDIFAATIEDILEIEDIQEQAYRLHLDFARNQFFYDGNKRTGLLLLNGHLMSNGYSPLSVPAMTDALQAGGWLWRNIVVWDKPTARPSKGEFKRQCEFILVGSKGKLIPATERCLPGVFRHSIVSSAKRMHLTEKPVPLLRGLLQITPKGGTILDPFAGSATTAQACLETGRQFIGVELSQTYFETACNRLNRFISE